MGMNNSEALLYVANKIGDQVRFYQDTNSQQYLDSLKAYIRTANIYLDRIQRGEE